MNARDEDSDREWITCRLAVLCADGKGVVRGGLVVFDEAVRVALFLDLVLRGRLQYGLDTSYIDTSATGFAAADAMLAYVDEHPSRPIGEMFSSLRMSVPDLLDKNVTARGRWRRRRSVVLDIETVHDMKKRVTAVAESGVADSPADAVLAAIASSVRLVPRTHSGELIARCGTHRGLVADCAGYLDALVEKSSLIAAIPQSAY